MLYKNNYVLQISENFKISDLREEVKKTLIVASTTYLIYLVFLLLVNTEKDYEQLSNGLIISILYFLVLILFIINCIYREDFKRVNSKALRILSDFELIIRGLVFIFICTNIEYWGIVVDFKIRLIVIIVACALSLSSIVLVLSTFNKGKINIHNNKYEFTKKEIDSYKDNYDHISFIGMILYFCSASMTSKNTFCIVIKSIVFIISLTIILNKLKKYNEVYKVNIATKKIIIFSSVGFIINIIIKDFLDKFNDLSIHELKDILVLVSIVFLIPLLKEYTSINYRRIVLRRYIKESKNNIYNKDTPI